MTHDAAGLAVGIDIGGTKIAAGLVDPANTVLRRLSVDTPADAGPGPVLAAAVRLARQLITAVPSGDRAVAVGVGSAGAIDSTSRRVLASTNHLRGWAGTDIGTAVERELALPVAVDNDARAHAAGEAVAGAGQGRRIVVVAAVGTGIGGAVVVDGTPLGGAHGVAGHLGHVPVAEAAGMPCPCGLTGHLESISSGGGLVALYEQRTGDRTLGSAQQIIAAAEANPVARECVLLSAGVLGRTLAGVAGIIDPDVTIIAGGLRGAGPLWWDAVRGAMDDAVLPMLRPCTLVPAELGPDAAIIGAAHLARRRVGSSRGAS